MRIALFTETYLPQINGVVTHVKTLKEGLEKLGHQVLVVTANSHTHHHYQKGDVLYCPAATVKRIYGYSAALPISRTRLKYIRRFNPDVIHIHTELGIGISGMVAAKILHLPLVYTLHTMYDEYIYYLVPGSMVKSATKLSHQYIRFIANRAQALTGPSEKCSNYFHNAGVVGKDVTVIPNAVELEDFNPSRVDPEKKREFRSRYHLDDDMMLACFVGRLGKEKSVDVLLENWAATIKPEEKIHLMIIGGGPFLEPYRQMAQELGIGNMVTFTGAVEHGDIPPYYASCDVYVTASLSDTCSISMLEGMASGLPVLQRKDPINANQVLDGINGFNFETAEEMAAYLRKIKAMNPQELAALKESVISSVRKSSSEDLAGTMITIYEKLKSGATHR